MMLLEQVASLVVGTKKLLFLKFTFNSLLGGDFLLTQHRETLLVEIQNYSVKVFSEIHARITAWIDYLTGGSNPFCIFNKNRVSLYYIWVYPPEIARSIRWPRPILMKLSGFVELFVLIILVVNSLGFP